MSVQVNSLCPAPLPGTKCPMTVYLTSPTHQRVCLYPSCLLGTVPGPGPLWKLLFGRSYANDLTILCNCSAIWTKLFNNRTSKFCLLGTVPGTVGGGVPRLVSQCPRVTPFPAACWSSACKSHLKSQPHALCSQSWMFVKRQHKRSVIHKLHKLPPLALSFNQSAHHGTLTLNVLNKWALFMKHQAYKPKFSWLQWYAASIPLCGCSASLDTRVPSYGQDSGSSWKMSVLR